MNLGNDHRETIVLNFIPHEMCDVCCGNEELHIHECMSYMSYNVMYVHIFMNVIRNTPSSYLLPTSSLL